MITSHHLSYVKWNEFFISLNSSSILARHECHYYSYLQYAPHNAEYVHIPGLVILWEKSVIYRNSLVVQEANTAIRNCTRAGDVVGEIN